MILLERMWERVERSKQASDPEMFSDLLLIGEVIFKISVLWMASAIKEDPDSYRYRFLYRLVRADGLGEWGDVLKEILDGPAAKLMRQEIQLKERKELTQFTDASEWQREAVIRLAECLPILSLQNKGDREWNKGKVQGRNWFELFARIRNGTRAHGAARMDQKHHACQKLEQSLKIVCNNFTLFEREWVYLFRTISGKYRLTQMSESMEQTDSWASESEQVFANGVYAFSEEPILVQLLETDPNLMNFFLPNGAFTDTKFEMLSYLDNERLSGDSSLFMIPPGSLPTSQTSALGDCELVGQSYVNFPERPQHYIEREDPEKVLTRHLLDRDMDRIITLSGSGGVGKTSITLEVLHRIAEVGRYQLIFWFSSRDIDLLVDGPVRVRPDVVSDLDIANRFASLLFPVASRAKGFDPRAVMSDYLSGQGQVSFSPILFVFDNFETVRSPKALYEWLYNSVRHPNKVLITTRHGEFTGDLKIPIEGMSDIECRALIQSNASRLHINHLLDEAYVQKIMEESNGHPYVIKILLGEIARAGRKIDIGRILASQDKILDALFERTYQTLSPAGQRVFLTLCTWDSVVPFVALQAVMLRPSNERMDIIRAVEELDQLSMIELSRPELSSREEISVLPAALAFGRAKIRISPFKSEVEANGAILKLFGSANKIESRYGMRHRIDKLFSNISLLLNGDLSRLDEFLPVITLLAENEPIAWIKLADLYQEDGTSSALLLAKKYVTLYLQHAPYDRTVLDAWKRLAFLCEVTNDPLGQLHALVEMSENPMTPFIDISNSANKLNSKIRFDKALLQTEEKEILFNRLATILHRRKDEGDGTDYSRLGWLFINQNRIAEAREVVAEGLRRFPSNDYLQKLNRDARLHTRH